MKKQKKTKLTILEVVSNILESDLPMSTRNEITRYYLLPRLGRTQAIIEEPKFSVGTVERPDAHELFLEDHPKIKAGDKATEKLMGEDEEEDDED